MLRLPGYNAYQFFQTRSYGNIRSDIGQEFNLANEDALDEYLALARTFAKDLVQKVPMNVTRTCDIKSIDLRIKWRILGNDLVGLRS